MAVLARGLATILIATLAASLALSAAAAESPDPRLAKARAAISALAEGLKSRLMAAINEGGPLSAIAVCKTVAPVLAAETSATHGVEIRRTALRVRNSENAPDPFERRVLEEFLAKAKAGAEVASLEHIETSQENGRRTLRYMKAIPFAEVPCATCHGASIEPSLEDEILKLYPEDAATGFSPGDLRGAFSVTIRD